MLTFHYYYHNPLPLPTRTSRLFCGTGITIIDIFVHTKLEEVLKTKHYVSCKMLWDISYLSKHVIPRMLTQEHCESHTQTAVSSLIWVGNRSRRVASCMIPKKATILQPSSLRITKFCQDIQKR
jgi:hypothetical protein